MRGEQVASAIEGLLLTATESLPPPTFAQRIRSAQRCYDYVAGRLGVAMCDFVVAHRYVIAGAQGVTLTRAGGLWLGSLDIESPPELHRPLVRFCQDWTERRAHRAGWLGATRYRRLEEREVIRGLCGSRVLTVTPPRACRPGTPVQPAVGTERRPGGPLTFGKSRLARNRAMPTALAFHRRCGSIEYAAQSVGRKDTNGPMEHKG